MLHHAPQNFTSLFATRAYATRMEQRADAHLLLAILKVAREECAHNGWGDLEPVLAAAWEDLRDEGTPTWDVVAEEIQLACQREGILDRES
jgi:hypothetical protein